MEQFRLDAMLDNARLHAPAPFTVHGEDPIFPSRFRVGEASAVAQGLAASAAAELHARRTGDTQSVSVDVGAAAATLVSHDFELIDGEPVPQPWWEVPATNAMYRCRAGDWIYLQGQLPHLHQGILGLLGCGDDALSVGDAVAGWDSFELEAELAERRLCGARARTPEEWATHPQGAYLQQLPAVRISRIGDGRVHRLAPADRPLDGVRVLEFARILAGPMTGRTLAEHGADVLNVSSSRLFDFFMTTLVTGRGKRSTFLDLDDGDDLSRLRALLDDCDVFVDGFRPGALAARGLGPEELAELRPGIVYVTVSCYGNGGPWRERRGWEQLAQMVSGLAIGQGSPEQPEIVLPGAPNDFITGILAAYGTITALTRRSEEGGSWLVEASLSQTAGWIVRNGTVDPAHPGGVPAETRVETQAGPLGACTHLAPVVRMSRTPPRWERGTPQWGADSPSWTSSRA
ncbi:MAG: CoA transferase [Pseudonocardia sp.]|uniref:CoA transferase n=1 Tax=unclassified Pseudonocardia TaxID=2619320 RepID=UPI00086B72DC|nr:MULTISPECIES: CoA transferase [unclassified Pseudonocardia]MBN9109392.1 CoA transferase [Pseudonocardia sp.]ODU29961.1 MAG: hypothetical protein ABS80_01120 [Pseudonocardia sp. SCN 72-51]ODV08102.1 MAG: hypothetical protein ABT15_05280 [Pseudonocardia sp. SCN 73-27]